MTSSVHQQSSTESTLLLHEERSLQSEAARLAPGRTEDCTAWYRIKSLEFAANTQGELIQEYSPYCRRTDASFGLNVLNWPISIMISSILQQLMPSLMVYFVSP